MAEMKKNPPEQREGAQVPVRRTEGSTLSSRPTGALSTEWQRPWPASPFGLMRRMFDDMDRLFGNFGFGGSFPGVEALERSASGLWSPQVEVFERGDQLVVRADLPGLSKDDIQLDLQDDALTIRGQRREQHEESREGYTYSERSYGSFSRQIAVPRGVSADQVDASFENGVLEVKMKVPEESRRQQRRLEIRSGSSEGAQIGTPTASSGSASSSSSATTATSAGSNKATPQSQPVK